MRTYFIHFHPQCLFWTCSQTTQISSPQCNNLCTGRASIKDLTVLWLCGRIVIFVLCVNNVTVTLKSWNKILTLDWIIYIFLHGRSGFQHLLEMRVLAEMWHWCFFSSGKILFCLPWLYKRPFQLNPFSCCLWFPVGKRCLFLNKYYKEETICLQVWLHKDLSSAVRLFNRLRKRTWTCGLEIIQSVGSRHPAFRPPHLYPPPLVPCIGWITGFWLAEGLWYNGVIQSCVLSL